ncbi:MAG: DUF262 domain-containing protein [Halodesulfovibrio sp.]|uniref:DUF262 domain-containing protein n=1 Tax=Halodesulfovibrio sp. TaxID=1912772 RepID=UPI00359F06FC
MILARLMDFDKKSIKWLSDLNRSGLLVVDESFQRRFVWNESQRIALIETVLLGYPIPEIYIWKTGVDPDTGDATYSIVDGQQRLKSIFKFLSQDFFLEKKSLDVKSEEYAGKKFFELTDQLRSQLWDYPFFVRIIPQEVKREEIVKMFLRLNKTDTSLNPQELRNAKFEGKFLRLATQLSLMPFWKEHEFFSTTDIRRMKDVQFISTLLIFFRYGIEGETTQAAINKAYDQFNDEYKEREDDKELFTQLLANINSFIKDSEQVVRFVKSQAHFYALFVLAYSMKLKGEVFKQDQLEKYEQLVRLYKELPKGAVPKTKIEKIVSEYRVAATEGMQKKANRLTRFKKLKEFLELK